MEIFELLVVALPHEQYSSTKILQGQRDDRRRNHPSIWKNLIRHCCWNGGKLAEFEKTWYGIMESWQSWLSTERYAGTRAKEEPQSTPDGAQKRWVGRRRCNGRFRHHHKGERNHTIHHLFIRSQGQLRIVSTSFWWLASWIQECGELNQMSLNTLNFHSDKWTLTSLNITLMVTLPTRTPRIQTVASPRHCRVA